MPAIEVRSNMIREIPFPCDPVIALVGEVEQDAGRSFSFESLAQSVCRVPGCLTFQRQARRMTPRVVVCERDLRDGTWRDVLNLSLALRPAPPVIVTSRLADDRLWAEVLNLGGYDVLMKPLDTDEVLRTLTMACGGAGFSLRRATARL
jgi:DNA-binding response OmpR family regulator